MKPIRIQFISYGTLVAEVILEAGWVSDNFAAVYNSLRIRRGKSMCWSVSQRADLPRAYNVPVGAEI